MKEKMKKEHGKVVEVLLIALALFILVILIGSGQFLMDSAIKAIGSYYPAVGETPVWQTADFYVAFIGWHIALLLYMWIVKKNRPIFKAMGTKAKGNNAKGLGIGLLVGFGMNALCILIAGLNGDIHLYFDNFSLPACVYLLICVAIQCSAEEVLDRAFLYQRLRRIFKNPWVAIIVNAIFFASLHVSNNGVTALSLINIVLLGVLLSMFVYYTDSFWAACGLHTAWNFCQNIIFGLPNSGNVTPYSFFKLDAANARDSFAYNAGFGIEGTVVATLVLALTGVLFYFLWARKKAVAPIDIWADERAAELSE
jgi:membrane protease YdiL (CAAX protease family)